MLIAAKYEEFRPPEVGDICYIMDNAYNREDILEMEVKILNAIKFEVTTPSRLSCGTSVCIFFGVPEAFPAAKKPD